MRSDLKSNDIYDPKIFTYGIKKQIWSIFWSRDQTRMQMKIENKMNQF